MALSLLRCLMRLRRPRYVDFAFMLLDRADYVSRTSSLAREPQAHSQTLAVSLAKSSLMKSRRKIARSSMSDRLCLM